VLSPRSLDALGAAFRRVLRGLATTSLSKNDVTGSAQRDMIEAPRLSGVSAIESRRFMELAMGIELTAEILTPVDSN
jgi:hypothetical protein